MTVKKQGENQWGTPPMEGFSWGVLIGAFIGNFMVQIWGARKVGMRFTMALDFRHPDLLLYVRVTLPLMISLFKLG